MGRWQRFGEIRSGQGFALAGALLRGFHEGEQRFEVAAVVAGLIDGCFRDEGAVGEARIVEQALEGGQADGAPADVLVAVEAGSAGRFGVVHVPDADLGEADGAIDKRDGFLVAGVGDDVVSGDVAVAGVEAGADGDDRAEALQQFSDLFEAASQGELGSGGVLDEDAEVAVIGGMPSMAWAMPSAARARPS